MGAWGSGPFENDDATAWVNLLAEANDPAGFLVRTLGQAVSTEEYLQVEVGAEVVAAAASVVADPSLAARPDLRREALRALGRVLGDRSELAELWSGDAGFAASTGSLRQALLTPVVADGAGRSTARKRRRPGFRPGAMFRVSLGDGTATYLRMLAGDPHIAYFDHRVDDAERPRPKPDELRRIAGSPVLFVLAGAYGYPGTETDWTAVGTVPTSEIDIPIPPQFVQDRQDPKRLRLLEGDGSMRPATLDECRGLERASVWSWDLVQERLRDHYAGRANQAAEDAALVIPTD